ncbi:hypothetical protein Y032_0270g870 [Ancylostoma ceylanicum]|uniref:A20-type domain-containing protein n=1 Tax=Ancylostoma ceylanicum TaxID=53326 RepID=A0A016S8M9_9BILA|nr:hypothetical protein Y032_0270g870 [Ancylostoma ceylanicum]
MHQGNFRADCTTYNSSRKDIVLLKNPCIMLHRPSTETRRITCALSYMLRCGSLDAQCSVRQGFLRKTAGVAGGTQEKKRIINEITQQFLRTFRLSNGKNKENGIDARTCAADLSRTSCLIASRLVSSSHEYMEEMVREYMRSARERFLSSKQPQSGRKRISRSFSASSLMITCINQYCGKPALQTNNFLCRECFEHQKEQMMSFNCENPHLLKRIPAAVMSTTAKSTTMPAIATPTRCTSRDALRMAGQNTARPAPVLGVTREGMSTTTNISTIEGENGVTHYYVSGEDPPVHLSPSHSSCAASQTMSPVRVTATLSQLAS